MFLTTVKVTAKTDYEVHQHLHHLFREQNRVFLWRWLDRGLVCVLSVVKPIDTVSSETISVDRLQAGRPLSFSLRFVAARCKRREGKIGAKVPIRGTRERKEWLAAKLAAAGARLLFAQIEDAPVIAKDGFVIMGAEASGMLMIDDRARFAAHLQDGIGRNRAFGCGLIWLPEIMS